MKFFLLLIVVSLAFACSSNRKIQFTRLSKIKTVKNDESNKSQSFLSTNSSKGIKKLIKPETLEVTSGIDSIQYAEVMPHSESSDQRLQYKSSTVEAPSPQKKYSEPVRMNLKSAKNNDVSAWFAIRGGILGVLMGLVLVTNKSSALKISHWAKKNRRKSIGLIVVIKIILGTIGFYAGKEMFDSGLLISSTTTHSLVSIMALTAITYPRKNTRFSFLKHSYLRQKMHDIALSLCGVLLMASIGNQTANTFKGPTSISFKNGIQNSSSPSKEFEESEITIVQIKPAKTRVAANVFITLLLTIAVVFLALALAMLVCNLSCSGQEVLATIVAIAGPIVLITLFILALKAIWKKDTEQIE